MARTLHHTFRWHQNGGSRGTPERGDLDRHVHGDPHWQSCLALVPRRDLHVHPCFVEASLRGDRMLYRKLLSTGYAVVDERSGQDIGIVVKSLWHDRPIPSWNWGYRYLYPAGRPREEERYRVNVELTPSVSRRWFTLDTEGQICGPGVGPRDELWHLAIQHRLAYVEPPAAPEAEPEFDPLDPGAALDLGEEEALQDLRYDAPR